MIEIIRARPRTVVGLEVRAHQSELRAALVRTWAVFRARAGEIQRRTNDRFLDVSLGAHDDIHTHLLCAEVQEVVDLPQDMMALAIPSQTYLHVRHIGPGQEIENAFDEIYLWARINGFAVEEFRIHEGYGPGPAARSHDLYVRVEVDRIRSAIVRQAPL
jgi:predicted transcriptional regulator YdeE